MQVGRFLRRSSWIGFSGLLALPLAADGARILDAAGDRNYADVQAAIEDAVDGDIILVGEGNYGSLLIDGKGIAVFAAPGEQVRIDGTVTIRNLTWHNVVLSGLDVQPVEFATALTLVNNSGHVRLLDCTFTGGSDVYAGGFGGPGASLSTSVGVDFVNCIVQGGNGVPNLQAY